MRRATPQLGALRNAALAIVFCREHDPENWWRLGACRACWASMIFRKLVLLFGIVASAWAARAAAEDWPQFRGPTGQGHSGETGLPVRWTATEGVAWSAAIPGRGWSSPVVKGGRVWLTTALDGGKSLRAICRDTADGSAIHDVEVFQSENPGSIHSKNSHASPTPVLEDDRAYVHFGAHGTACVDAAGKVVWRAEQRYAHRHGPAGSPVLYRDLLILSCDGTDVQYVVALDKATGKVRWRTDRTGPMAYSTPLVVRVEGVDQLVSPGGRTFAAYEPASGAEIWRCNHGGYSVVPRPVEGAGLLFLVTGFDESELFAVRPGRGDVTATNIAWTLKRAVPHNPSPLFDAGSLYIVSDAGVATALDATTGKQRWQKRIGGSFSASPVLADGKIYFLDEDGTTTVIAAGGEYRELAKNELGERSLASMAVSGGSLYIRTEGRLYRITGRGSRKS
jgi:outer membrane protein assembly factor BamB